MEFFRAPSKGLKTVAVVVLLMLSSSSKVQAQDADGFAQWYEAFAQDALTAGIAPTTLRQVYPLLSLDESVIELDQRQPESKTTFAGYAKNILKADRIQKGRQLMERYRPILSQLSIQYGMSPSIIVALWGIESSYGTNMGDYAVINSLATLAYEGRRAAFFKKELIEALHIIEEERMDPLSLKGSWAGAMGQCQFMPSTYRQYAIDFVGDGSRDIWGDESDVLASIAHYLSAEGWRHGYTWGREVMVPRTISAAMVGLEFQQDMKHWAKMGLKTLSGRPLPVLNLQASLIQPDGSRGRSFLVYDNFRALMRWNKSTYFATGVGLLADQMDPLK